MPDAPKVAVLIDTSYEVRRDLLLGINRYVQHHGPWNIDIAGTDGTRVIRKLRGWDGQGIIARLHDDRVAQAVLEAAVPTIAICLTEEQRRRVPPSSNLSDVAFDAAQDVARLAADHFLDRDFRQFAFVGFADVDWSLLRERAFCRRIQEAGFPCRVYQPPRRLAERVWEKEQPILTQWIRSLPRPVGILACNDERGRQVLEACRFAEVAVPEDVAVLGVDNDEMFCTIADPPLSSVTLDAETTGYSVAQLLDRMMRGDVTESQQVNVGARGVIPRRSTDIFAVHDSDVSQALRFIHRSHGCGISVADVAHEVALSRRTLEKRFFGIVGRTVLEEIQRARLRHAKQLLVESKQPISKVAMLVGFSGAGSFVRFFQARTGVSPTDFRGAAGELPDC